MVGVVVVMDNLCAGGIPRMKIAPRASFWSLGTVICNGIHNGHPLCHSVFCPAVVLFWDGGMYGDREDENGCLLGDRILSVGDRVNVGLAD